MEFHSGYFDYKGAFGTAIDSYCELNMKILSILHFSNDNWGMQCYSLQYESYRLSAFLL